MGKHPSEMVWECNGRQRLGITGFDDANPVSRNLVAVLNLFRVMQSVPKSLNDQTDQTIRGSIRNNRPIQPKSEVEMDTRKHNWAS
jgi:hypothetical protein